jgi:hypothetical protein
VRVECPSARSRDEAPASLFLFAQTMTRIVACVLVALAALVKRHSPTLGELLHSGCRGHNAGYYYPLGKSMLGYSSILCELLLSNDLPFGHQMCSLSLLCHMLCLVGTMDETDVNPKSDER